MKNIFKCFFGTWWRPVLLWFISCWVLGLSEILRNNNFSKIAILFFVIGLFVLVISSFNLLSNKKYLMGFLSLCFAKVAIFVLYNIALFFINRERPDEWAKNLKIPTNIVIDNPVNFGFDAHRPLGIANKKVLNTDFQLYNSFQPGLYEYDFWIGNIEKGTIYLKAYEITQEYVLSKESLTQNSRVEIYNPTAGILKFGTKSHFTIYEGDWGQPYAARFEVWFKPENGGMERKLFAKNYKIEGWMH